MTRYTARGKTSEFLHYQGCKHNDPDNCGACALTDLRQARPNYAGWPLAYMMNGRVIPAKWRQALADELARTDNPAYVENLRQHIRQHGARFTDGSTFDLNASPASKATAA